MNLLANTVTTLLSNIWDNLASRLQTTEVILGIVFAMLGIATAALARRITRIIRNRNTIDDNDKILIAIKVIGLVFMFISFLILLLQTTF